MGQKLMAFLNAECRIPTLTSHEELTALVEAVSAITGMPLPTQCWEETSMMYVFSKNPLDKLWGRFLFKAGERWEEIQVEIDGGRWYAGLATSTIAPPAEVRA